jgi:MYXO-CTERM domain-containing protein
MSRKFRLIGSVLAGWCKMRRGSIEARLPAWARCAKAFFLEATCMRALLRGSLATLVGSVSLFVASTAFADGEACYNDIDCPGTACGDAVCNWSKQAAMPMGTKVFACNPAGSQPDGKDGWCTTDTDCKCKGEGATCVAPYCTFTKKPGGSTGGTSSTGGTAATTGGTPSTGGTTGGTPAATGGTPASTGGTASPTGGTPASTGGTAATTGGSTSTPPPTDDGGCSVTVPGRANTSAALGVGLLAVGLAFARRRRR